MSLFPDLDGLSAHINWSFTYLPYSVQDTTRHYYDNYAEVYAKETQKIKDKALKNAKLSRDQAWKLAQAPLQVKLQELKSIYTRISHDIQGTRELAVALNQLNPPQLGEMTRNARRMQFLLKNIEIIVITMRSRTITVIKSLFPTIIILPNR